MAVSAKVGSVATPTSTGNVAYTGLGFQPKLLFFNSSNVVTSGFTTDIYASIGFAVSSTDRRCGTCTAVDNQVVVCAGHDNTKCISIIDNNPNVITAADLVSMDSDGFTLNWSTVDAGRQRVVSYFGLGGSDITNVKGGQNTCPGSTGNQAVTGIGFRPDMVFFFEGRRTGTAPPSNLSSAVPQHLLGFATSSTARGQANSLMTQANNGAEKSRQTTDKVISCMAGTGTVEFEADFVSMDSDGFTINWTTVLSGRYYFYVCVKGGQWKVGSFNQPTSTGNVASTAPGFTPSLLLLQSYNFASSSSAQGDNRRSIGFGTSSSNRRNNWIGSTDNSNPRKVQNRYSATTVLDMCTQVSNTVLASADIVSMDATGFTLNWGTADATAREVLYVAVGSNAQTATGNFFRMF